MVDIPKTLTAQLVSEAMEVKNIDKKELASQADTTYEHIRKILAGDSFPSKYLIRVLSDVLGIKKSELDQAVVADQIRHRYGKIPALLSGKNPDLEPVERVWGMLTKDQQDTFVAQMEAVAKKNKRDRVAVGA